MSSWDDDDFDVDPAGVATKKINEEEEDVLDDWEQHDDQPTAPAAPAPPPSASASAQPASNGTLPAKSKPPAKKEPAEEAYVALDDPLAEKLRRQKLEEQSNDILAADLFAGCPRPDPSSGRGGEGNSTAASTSAADGVKERGKATKVGGTGKDKGVAKDLFDDVSFKSTKDLEAFAAKLSDKIVASPVKSAGWFRFLDLVLRDAQGKLDAKDCKKLISKLNEYISLKETAKRQAEDAKKKPNKVKMDAKDEMDIMYGEGAEEEYEEDDEEYYKDFM
ncbi:unnamed protein product [Vitrella brassicaformis CCMP3155]|uniref:Uncharacterized protein n=1 Tax=Vitrella brassicaformis (strain CCMP3155) TaxID=1169540 RepID=A0A0G4F0B3_VITBC|nr:unnamed protein product [Vitrella brassicaformis CCMP3155]|eukprot:CEM04649.1 unnamed protein product [Vitrella brassicaformis CCMP3155]